MLKRLFLLMFLTTLPLFPRMIAQSTCIEHEILQHIGHTRTDIMLEIQMAITISQRATKHFQELLADNYETIKSSCFEILNIIITSSEFTTTVEQVTDEQMDLIINHLIKYNDIIIDPSAYPLEEKIKKELTKASFDEKTEQLFNVFYVVFATIYGSKKLLEKLAIKEKDLNAELKPLNPSIQSVTL